MRPALWLLSLLTLLACSCQALPAPGTTPQAISTPIEPIVRAGRGGIVSGTVAQIQGNALTLRTIRGNVLVLLHDGAAMSKLAPAAAGDLTPGAQASVRGHRNEAGAYEAFSVSVTPAGLHVPDSGTARGFGFSSAAEPPLAGIVQAVSSNGFNLQTDSGTVAVVVTSNTHLSKVLPAVLGELREGQRAVAGGEVNVDGSLGANEFEILTPASP